MDTWHGRLCCRNLGNCHQGSVITTNWSRRWVMSPFNTNVLVSEKASFFHICYDILEPSHQLLGCACVGFEPALCCTFQLRQLRGFCTWPRSLMWDRFCTDSLYTLYLLAIPWTVNRVEVAYNWWLRLRLWLHVIFIYRLRLWLWLFVIIIIDYDYDYDYMSLKIIDYDYDYTLFFDYDYDYDYNNHISWLQSRLRVIKIILVCNINDIL